MTIFGAHYLLLEAYTSPRAKLEENCKPQEKLESEDKYVHVCFWSQTKARVELYCSVNAIKWLLRHFRLAQRRPQSPKKSLIILPLVLMQPTSPGILRFRPHFFRCHCHYHCYCHCYYHYHYRYHYPYP